MSARSARRRLRRTWPQRLLIGFNVCCVLAALGGAAIVAYAKDTVGQIGRVSIGRDTIRPVDELASDEPRNFLITGIDSADGTDQAGMRADLVGVRPDVIMVVRVDPGEGEARILSLNRDLWVDIPGQGRNKINATMAYGEEASPSLLIETIRANFQIEINHYVQVDFAGFQEVVGHINGVRLYLSSPVRDGNSGLNQPAAGCVLLDSQQALAYVRSRALQYLDPATERWTTDPTADLGRTSRQQELIRQLLSRAIERGARNPATLARMVETGAGAISLDEFTTPQDLIALGRSFRDYDPALLRTDSLPVADRTIGAAEGLEVIEAPAQPILEQYRAADEEPEGDLDPATVTVRVLNGTGRSGQGAEITRALEDVGFRSLPPGDETSRPARTEVRYPVGEEDRALAVARHLLGDPVLVPTSGISDITLVTGPDLFSVLDEPRDADEFSLPDDGAEAGTTTSEVAPDPADPGDAADADADDEPEVVRQPPGYLPGSPPPGETCG
jgi:polyisoprenyl-teichoic acid--peptidoglycan teichoic acid transferase